MRLSCLRMMGLVILMPGTQIETTLDDGAGHTTVADIDGDGDLDLITAAPISDAIVVFKNDGLGNFDPGTQIETTLDDGAGHTTVEDIDGDGDLDLITAADASDAFVVFKNDGSGNFDAGTQIETTLDDVARRTTVADIDGDGDLDLITAADASDAFVVFKNDGSGNFDAGTQIETTLDDGAYHTTVADIDGDGDLDLITAAPISGAFVVFKNDGLGNFDAGTQIETTLDDGGRHTTVADIDGDGDPRSHYSSGRIRCVCRV